MQSKNSQNLVFDSNALVKLFKKEPGWERVRELLESCSTNRSNGYITSLNYGEILFSIFRDYGQKAVTKIRQNLEDSNILEFVNADLSDCIAASHLKMRGGIAYSDCFVLNLANKVNGTVVTGDQEFKKFEGEFQILWV